MTEEVPSNTEEIPKTEEPINTLESLTNEINKLREDFNNKLIEKDKEINSLNEYNTKLTNQLKEQDTLIGNYKDKLFNMPAPQEEIQNIEKINMDNEYFDAFTSVYNQLKHRLTGNNKDKNLFVNKCMEAYNGNI